jgi:hypothetical protein
MDYDKARLELIHLRDACEKWKCKIDCVDTEARKIICTFLETVYASSEPFPVFVNQMSVRNYEIAKEAYFIDDGISKIQKEYPSLAQLRK